MKTSELVTVRLPLSNIRVSKLASINQSRILVMLTDDHKIYFIDIDRNYSVICALAHKSKVSWTLTEEVH